MLFACISAKNPEVTFERAKAFVTRKNLVKAWTTVLAAWLNGMADPEPADENEIP
jgi:hypothetical protein